MPRVKDESVKRERLGLYLPLTRDQRTIVDKYNRLLISNGNENPEKFNPLFGDGKHNFAVHCASIFLETINKEIEQLEKTV